MNSSLAERIADTLRDEIEKGILRPTQKLDSYEKLGKRFDADKNTAGRAVGLLQTQGLVQTIHGKGSFVLDPSERGEEPGNGELLKELIETIHSQKSQIHDLSERVHRLESQLGVQGR